MRASFKVTEWEVEHYVERSRLWMCLDTTGNSGDTENLWSRKPEEHQILEFW